MHEVLRTSSVFVNLHRLRNKFKFWCCEEKPEEQEVQAWCAHSASVLITPRRTLLPCCTIYEDISRREWSRLMTLAIIYDWNIIINVSTRKASDGSLYQRQFVRCLEKGETRFIKKIKRCKMCFNELGSFTSRDWMEIAFRWRDRISGGSQPRT